MTSPARTFFLFSTVCLFLTTAASGQDLQKQLDATYKNKLYLLRHPARSESLHYDTTGQLIGSVGEGPWTVYSGLELAEVSLSPGQLRITANRLVYIYDQAKKDLAPRKMKRESRVKIDVALSHPVTTVGEVGSILRQIFVLDPSELADTVPDYWRPFLLKQTTPVSPAENAAPVEIKRSPNDVIEVNGVTAPKPVYTPEPEYSEIARKFTVNGTLALKLVIDNTGAVSHAEIVRPLGIGMDEQAVTRVHDWKFKPATREGKPVSVEMNIEIAFHLS